MQKSLTKYLEIILSSVSKGKYCMTKWNFIPGRQGCLAFRNQFTSFLHTSVIFTEQKSHMIILTGVEEAPDKILHQIIKVLSNLGIEGNFLNLTEGTCNKPHSYYNNFEKLNGFFIKL